ncbi:MAG: hypothetical protein AAGG08_04385 [Actinomycetota bacterium]
MSDSDASTAPGASVSKRSRNAAAISRYRMRLDDAGDESDGAESDGDDVTDVTSRSLSSGV